MKTTAKKISDNLCFLLISSDDSSPSCDGSGQFVGKVENAIPPVVKMTYFCEKGASFEHSHKNMRKGAYVRFILVLQYIIL